jgi:hypothetical protein
MERYKSGIHVLPACSMEDSLNLLRFDADESLRGYQSHAGKDNYAQIIKKENKYARNARSLCCYE